MSKDKQMYTIKGVAEKVNLTPQTIRNWEREGLIEPTRIVGRQRVYFEDDIEKLEDIVKYRKQGYSLRWIKDIINGEQIIEDIELSSLEDKNTSELKEMAQEQGIKYFRQMYRHELITALKFPDMRNKVVNTAKERTKERYQIAQKQELLKQSNMQNLVSQ